MTEMGVARSEEHDDVATGLKAQEAAPAAVPVALLLTEGQRSDHDGAALLLPILPPAHELLGDRGYQ